jgi:phosphatidylglycerophosphatase A
MLWIAQGFGIGRIPVAPGTFGSLVGLLWFGLLVSSGRLLVLAVGTALGIALSIWLCGRAETILRQKDPGSIVLDEIVAMPICFFGWIGIVMWKTGSFPALADFFGATTCLLTLGVFIAFRFFDVAKPWPVRSSQALPGGWGVTIDDLLAALYVNALVLVACGARSLFKM